MDKLKCKIETIITVNASDWDQFIQEYYGQDYEFVADHEASNDSSYTFLIKPDEELADYDESQLNDFEMGRDPSYMTRILLVDLMREGIIPAGKYVFEVCW